MRPVILLLICVIAPLATAGSFTPMIRKFKAKEGNNTSRRAIRDSNYSNHIHNSNNHNNNNTHVMLSDELKALIDQEIVRQARLRLYPFINITSFSDTILGSLISGNSAVNYAFTNTSPQTTATTLADTYDEVLLDDTDTKSKDQKSPLHLTIPHSTIVPLKVWGEGSESKFGPIAEYVVQRIQSYFSVYKYDDLSRPAELSELGTTERVNGGEEDSSGSSSSIARSIDVESKQAENSVTESTTTKRTRKPRPTFGARRSTTASKTTAHRITTSKVTRTFKPRNTKQSRPSFFTKTTTPSATTTTIAEPSSIAPLIKEEIVENKEKQVTKAPSGQSDKEEENSSIMTNKMETTTSSVKIESPTLKIETEATENKLTKATEVTTEALTEKAQESSSTVEQQTSTVKSEEKLVVENVQNEENEAL